MSLSGFSKLSCLTAVAATAWALSTFAQAPAAPVGAAPPPPAVLPPAAPSVPPGGVVSVQRTTPDGHIVFEAHQVPWQPPSHEDHELARQAQSLLEQHRQQTDLSARGETQKQLAEVLTRQFDRRQAQRKQELDALKARVDKLQELFDKREQAKSQIVQSRLDVLLRDADGLGWGDYGENSRIMDAYGRFNPAAGSWNPVTPFDVPTMTLPRPFGGGDELQ